MPQEQIGQKKLKEGENAAWHEPVRPIQTRGKPANDGPDATRTVFKSTILIGKPGF